MGKEEIEAAKYYGIICALLANIPKQKRDYHIKKLQKMQEVGFIKTVYWA